VPGEREQRIPLWSVALAGGLLACALRESRRAAPQPPAPAAQRLHAGSLSHLAARELRALPGLGERRALALVDARWERAPGDPPLFLGDLPGIGGVVESAVRAVLHASSASREGTP
jgi:hypothetical protein